jgi:cystathionine gamma-synthase
MGHTDPITKAVVPPIHVATTYLRDPDNQYTSGYVYGRPDNATVREAEGVIAMWEEAEEALVFSSGMSAATCVFLALSPGDHVVAPTVMYWALRSWLLNDARHWGLVVDFVDTSDVDAVRNAVKPGKTKLVWLETPSNPLWSISDIAAIAAIAHGAGAKVAVDSTVATPVFTRPLAVGADIVMPAAT